MDVQMPDMNGFETASLIYQREKLQEYSHHFHYRAQP